jgi:hypothetical protein
MNWCNMGTKEVDVVQDYIRMLLTAKEGSA